MSPQVGLFTEVRALRQGNDHTLGVVLAFGIIGNHEGVIQHRGSAPLDIGIALDGSDLGCYSTHYITSYPTPRAGVLPLESLSYVKGVTLGTASVASDDIASTAQIHLPGCAIASNQTNDINFTLGQDVGTEIGITAVADDELCAHWAGACQQADDCQK